MKGVTTSFLALAAFLPICPANARLNNDVIFQCSTHSDGYHGRFTLSDSAELALEGTHGTSSFECRMRIEKFVYHPDAEIPNMILDMESLRCQKPDGTSYRDSGLMKTIYLVIKPGTSPRDRADVQWINYLQPSPCTIEKFKRESLVRDAEKFNEGLFR